MNTRLALKNCLGFTLTEEEEQIVQKTSEETMQRINGYIIETSGNGDDLELLLSDLVDQEKTQMFQEDLGEEERVLKTQWIDLQAERFIDNMILGRSSKEDLLGPPIHPQTENTAKSR